MAQLSTIPTASRIHHSGFSVYGRANGPTGAGLSLRIAVDGGAAAGGVAVSCSLVCGDMCGFLVRWSWRWGRGPTARGISVTYVGCGAGSPPSGGFAARLPDGLKKYALIQNMM